ncbi:hypothetical protein CGMCC3_g9316 [Colletotrichum fructicola]|nr:uncharacterized protein CGMCC3_g9316 [Colletotrichum fructicola]KAE9574730.1 hypothetical protein CGMCC3_g9316 [Colletotrichum fructicola]
MALSHEAIINVVFGVLTLFSSFLGPLAVHILTQKPPAVSTPPAFYRQPAARWPLFFQCRRSYCVNLLRELHVSFRANDINQSVSNTVTTIADRLSFAHDLESGTGNGANSD